jgi:hypothetical protein
MLVVDCVNVCCLRHGCLNTCILLLGSYNRVVFIKAHNDANISEDVNLIT